MPENLGQSSEGPLNLVAASGAAETNPSGIDGDAPLHRKAVGAEQSDATGFGLGLKVRVPPRCQQLEPCIVHVRMVGEIETGEYAEC